MKNVTVSITVSLPTDGGKEESHTITVENEFPEGDTPRIDDVEKTMLALNKEAIRQAVVAYCEDLSKKKPKMRNEIEEAVSKRILPRIESMEK